jgi:hypothetical protein
MNLQERATALMLVENDRVLSRITPRFLALWEEDTMELSTVVVAYGLGLFVIFL